MKRIQIRSLLCAAFLCAAVLCTVVLCAAVLPVYPAAADEAAAPDAIDSWDVSAPSEAEALPADTPSGEAPSAEALVPQAVPAQTEPVIPADLVETEPDFEPPADIADGLVRDTPDGEAAELSEEERTQYLKKLFFDNGPEAFLENHGDVSSTFLLLNEETGTFSEYCRTFTNRSIYYSDDWTPGMEELRLLIVDGEDCVEEYAQSIGCVKFINCSGKTLHNAGEDAAVLGEDTMDETLLRIVHGEDAEYVITQMTDAEAAALDLPSLDDGEFFSCTYTLEADKRQVRNMHIALHRADGSRRDLRIIRFSYDHGMPEPVLSGVEQLQAHLYPEQYWEAEDLRTVTVTLDPGTANARAVTANTLKGDPVSVLLPDGYALFEDAACSVQWLDDGDYTKDLVLWAAPDPAA